MFICFITDFNIEMFSLRADTIKLIDFDLTFIYFRTRKDYDNMKYLRQRQSTPVFCDISYSYYQLRLMRKLKVNQITALIVNIFYRHRGQVSSFSCLDVIMIIIEMLKPLPHTNFTTLTEIVFLWNIHGNCQQFYFVFKIKLLGIFILPAIEEEGVYSV